MEITKVDNECLLRRTLELARNEREITLLVLAHLREIDRRHLFAEIGYSSLYEYAVQELKYSSGGAHRRISSMKLLHMLPEIKSKIESGALSLSTLAQAQSFFRIEKTETLKEKRAVLTQLENKSKREVEKELVGRSASPEMHYTEKARAVTASHTELKLLVESKFVEQVEELRGLLAHSHPNASITNLLQHCLCSTLERTRPKAPRVEQVKLSSPPAEMRMKPARHIGVEIKRQVWQRDQGCCTYSHGGRVCKSKHGLEFDHIVPWAVGGGSSKENLRLRCRAHNQTAAINYFGRVKAAQFIPRLVND